MIITNKNQVFSAALLALLAAGCGKDKKETVYVTQPQTTTPQTAQPQQQYPNQQAPADSSQQADLLAVEIDNFSQINNQNIQNGTQIQFRLKNAQNQVQGIQFKCAVEAANKVGTSMATICTSPYTVQVTQDGQYTFSVYATQSAAATGGNPAQASFAIGAGQLPPGQNGGGIGGQPGLPGIGGQPGFGGAVAPIQVGDLFSVKVPSGMHIVYRSSTFDQPGYLKFRMIDASMRDRAAPYPLNCRQGANFEEMVPDMSPAGQQLNYCEITPPVAFNSPADPLFNSFRWMNMNTMSYNSVALSSDNSLSPSAPYGQQPVLSKLFINVFTNMTGAPTSQFQAPFTNELSQTVSRLQISCGAQVPQYLGTAGVFQGYFTWSIAAAPIFGCVNPRGGKWYVDIAAFPMDQVTPLLPSLGWQPWISQNFANTRAAEIVSEIGPFEYAPIPAAVAPDAQAMMIQHIKKLLP